MTAAPVSPHPLLAAVTTANRAIESVADIDPAYLTPEQKSAALIALSEHETRVNELKLRVLAASDDLGEAIGARDAGAWLTRTTRIDRRTAHSDVKLAHALDERYVRVAEAMRAGGLNRAQAAVIVHALDKLPDDLDPLALKRAERHLVDLAHHHDPADLRILGEHLLEVIAPDIADEADARALEREEQRARVKYSLRGRSRGDGTTSGSFVLPDPTYIRLLTYLDALAAPRKQRLSEDTERAPLHRRRGWALATLLERLDPAKLPDHGGHATTVIITIDHDQLTKRLGTATMSGSFDGDLRLSATETRRLACDAKIIPAVLGGKGEILDLGRARRLYSPAQHKAMRLRDKHCRAEGCRMPAAMCEAHHLKPWSQGGKTNLADGILLCSHHHHVAHDSRMTHERLPNGDYRFHRRT